MAKVPLKPKINMQSGGPWGGVATPAPVKPAPKINGLTPVAKPNNVFSPQPKPPKKVKKPFGR